MDDGDAAARPVFVLGAPRSGTTVVGRYVASAPGICDLGEYAGFFFAHHVAEREYRRVPTPYRERYLAELRDHARQFPARVARENGDAAYCDATPWNLLVAAELVELLPDALFVLTVRNVAGVSQSLERSYVAGYRWAGADVEARAALWRDFYSHVRELDPQRTVVVDYDDLCAAPAATLAELDAALAAHGLLGERDAGVFCDSHANRAGAARRTLGVRRPDGVELAAIPSVDRAAWTADADAAARAVVAEVAADVERFRSATRSSIRGG